MVRVCGMLGSRVCGLLGSVCGSVGLAVLVVALAAMATRHAYAEDPVEVGTNLLLNCEIDCVCNLDVCYDDICQNRDGCISQCKCIDKPPPQRGCKCIRRLETTIP